MSGGLIFDPTAVPEGPHGQFPRQLTAQFKRLTKEIADLKRSVNNSRTSRSPVGYFPRKKLGPDYVAATPYAIPWDEIGYAYDDTGWPSASTAAQHVTLPDSTTFAGYFGLANNNERSPYFLFHRTQSYNFVIHARGSDVIAVDLSDQSAAAGNIALTSGNSSVALRMMDTGWRAYAIAGTWEVDV